MKVTYIDHMGSDLSVVNAARVSFGKKSHWEGRVGGPNVLSERDEKLIKYLAKHNHWTPFAHTAVTLHVKAPLFVARQLGKHQVGLVWNEISRRYVDEEPEFYVPDAWRKRAKNVKQGSSDKTVDPGYKSYELFGYPKDTYLDMLNEGICPEQARMVLPQSMYTEWYWTGSIVAFNRVCCLRLDSHTQKETQEVAEQISEAIKPHFPVSWEMLGAYYD